MCASCFAPSGKSETLATTHMGIQRSPTKPTSLRSVTSASLAADVGPYSRVSEVVGCPNVFPHLVCVCVFLSPACLQIIRFVVGGLLRLHDSPSTPAWGRYLLGANFAVPPTPSRLRFLHRGQTTISGHRKAGSPRFVKNETSKGRDTKIAVSGPGSTPTFLDPRKGVLCTSKFCGGPL